MSTLSAADTAFEQRFAQLEGLLAELSASADPRAERVAREVLSTVLELHQRGLSRLLELAAPNSQVQRALARDAHVSSMLLLHDLHPLTLDARASSAVASLRERFRAELQDVTVEADGGRLALRLLPVASTCGSTRAALKREFEEALLAAVPDAESLSVELAVPEPALIALRVRKPATERSPGGQR